MGYLEIASVHAEKDGTSWLLKLRSNIIFIRSTSSDVQYVVDPKNIKSSLQHQDDKLRKSVEKKKQNDNVIK